MKNYYDLLEVSENASFEVIEKAYRVLAQKYHPDKWPNNQAYWAEDRFKEITEAYQTLSNANLRKEYDLKLGLNNSYKDKYNVLYEENQNLKHEVNVMKIRNKSNQYNKQPNNNNTNNNKTNYIKRYTSTIKSLIYDEAHKESDERSRDLKALILTIIIIAIFIFIAWKVPFLHNFIFP